MGDNDDGDDCRFCTHLQTIDCTPDKHSLQCTDHTAIHRTAVLLSKYSAECKLSPICEAPYRLGRCSAN